MPGRGNIVIAKSARLHGFGAEYEPQEITAHMQ
jgi:hypothetical protein